METPQKAFERLAAATAEYERLKAISEKADAAARAAWVALNAAQANCDTAMTEARQSAPDFTNWKAGA